MTPGYARPRSELPWLPYRTTDKVFVINSHNFGGGAFDPSVNGKAPIAAWIPSRDDAGNGTTTLTDLVGSNNGTLTNMDAATDWVVDTVAGGVRALDFSNGTDYVAISNVVLNGAFSVSIWFRRRTFPGGGNCLLGNTASGNTLLPYVQGSDYVVRADGGASQSYLFPTLQTFNHVVVTRNSSNNVRVFTNGVESSSGAKTLSGTFTINMIGRYQVVIFGLDGRLDDIRIFDQAINATDAAALYAAQRGGQA